MIYKWATKLLSCWRSSERLKEPLDRCLVARIGGNGHARAASSKVTVNRTPQLPSTAHSDE